MAWEQKCREEDMKQRALENERHAIDDARRSVDEKAEQLKVVANQSALFAGFSMVVLVESSIPPDIDGVLLTIFGGTVTASTSVSAGHTLHNPGTAPGSPTNGMIYYDSTAHKFKGRANGAWVDLH